MLIGIDASRANKIHKTGPEWYAYHLIKQFALLDKDNEYILYSNRPLRGGLMDLRKGEKNKKLFSKIIVNRGGLQTIQSPHNNFKAKILNWPFKYLWTLGGLSLEMILHRPDVLFVPSHTLPLFYPKKSIITIHDIGFEKDKRLFSIDEIGPESKKIKIIFESLVRLFTLGKYGANSMDYLRWSTKFALKRADTVITVSNFSKNEIKKVYNLKSDNIKVIYNGYDKLLYKKINNQEKIKKVLQNFGIEQPYIFYIGRLEMKKNIPSLIEAFAIMKEKNKNLKHKLVLVGDASFGYDEAKYMIREFELLNEVIMPGWVAEEYIPYLYNGSSAFIFPSNYEGFGLPLLQAMACEVPIAASKSSSIPEVCGDAALFFNPNFVLSISDALENILKNKELRDKLIKNGIKRSSNSSWKKSANKTLDILLS